MNSINNILDHEHLGKLILRVSFALMFLLHGIHKIGAGGLDFINSTLATHGLPQFIAYGVYLGEIIAPICIIIGLFTRFFAFIGVGTCLFITYLAHQDNLFALAKTGAWAAEGVGVFLFAFLAIMFLGSGRFAVKPD